MGDFMIYEHDLTDFQNAFIDALEDAVCSDCFLYKDVSGNGYVLGVCRHWDHNNTVLPNDRACYDFLDPDELPF